MSLKSTNKIETNTYELEIEASAEEFEAAVQAAYLKAKNKINVPGFRKGKVPMKVLENTYGKGLFFEEAVNIGFPRSLAALSTRLSLLSLTDPRSTLPLFPRRTAFLSR